jgi:hypothetical protein
MLLPVDGYCEFLFMFAAIQDWSRLELLAVTGRPNHPRNPTHLEAPWQNH